MKSMRAYSIQIDWLRYSVPYGTPLTEAVPLHPAFVETGEVLTSYPNYSITRSLVCGRTDENSERQEQRQLITMTGKDLARMRKMGLSDEQLLLDIHDTDGLHITRMDIAIDTRDTRLSPGQAEYDYKSGQLKSRARKMLRVDSTNSDGSYAGKTVYIGSRTSEQFLRVYDKAAEQGTKDHLTRVELELKGQKAFEALWAIIKHGIVGGGLAAMSRFFTWNNAAWQDITSGHSVQVERLAIDKPDGRREWLLKVALPAVVQAIGNNDAEVKKEVWSALEARSWFEQK